MYMGVGGRGGRGCFSVNPHQIHIILVVESLHQNKVKQTQEIHGVDVMLRRTECHILFVEVTFDINYSW